VVHSSILYNDQIRESASRVLSPGQIGLLSGWGVFSTIRIVDGVLFAWERHWARMQHDAKLLRVPFPNDSEAVRRSLLRLVEANQAQTATLRIVVVRNRGGIWEGPGLDRDYDLIALTTKLKDWGEGTRLAVVPQARHSAQMFAGVKSLSWSMNLCWYEMAQSRGNEHGKVSECTSANVFVAVGNRVYTPPLGSGCLPGVTRDVLLSGARVPGIVVEEKDLSLEDLESADEVFITSTTRNLLSVLAIEGMEVRQRGDVRRRVSEAFSEFVRKYVEANRGASGASQPS
jgi:branched-chain amino acid aminotransferase